MLPDGRRQILNYALPADLVGLQGSLMREMEHSVEALTPLTLCVFPRAKLWELYSKFPSLAFDVTWLAAREEQLIDEALLSVGRRSALERTAYVLLHLFVRAKEVGLGNGGSSIQFPFTQQHLADTLGMSLVHTNKTLKRLAASNAIRWSDRVFEVLDRRRSNASPATTAPSTRRGRLSARAAFAPNAGGKLLWGPAMRELPPTATGLAHVRAEIARACREAGRDPAAVTLVAVSKTFGADAIEPVIAAGQRVFGENRVQEAKAKWPPLLAQARRASSCT